MYYINIKFKKKNIFILINIYIFGKNLIYTNIYIYILICNYRWVKSIRKLKKMVNKVKMICSNKSRSRMIFRRVRFRDFRNRFLYQLIQ